VELRDRAEHAIRRFHALEVANGGDPVIDYDCAPTTEHIEPYPDRFTALDELTALKAEAGDGPVAEQLTAHATYLAALMGEQIPLDDYLRRTQGCGATAWSDDYLVHRRAQAAAALADLGISWGEKCRDELRALDEQLAPGDVAEVIGEYADEYEPFVRDLAQTTATFNLTIEDVEHDEYWSYWLDGAGHDARLRINRKTASFTRGDAYRFALHEVLGHALQYASITEYAEAHDVPCPRLLAVHSNHQVLFEGLAQFLPLVASAADPVGVASARLDHFTQLLRAELHLMVNAGASVNECLERAIGRAPYLSAKDIEREIRDRSRDPRLRSYLWSYPAGVDWFMNLWEQEDKLLPEVLRAAYQRPLSPSELDNFRTSRQVPWGAG
jgi:hypothetical protein